MPASAHPVVPLLGLTREHIRAHMVRRDIPAFRADQVVGAVFARRVGSFDDIVQLPKAMRATLRDNFSLARPRVQLRRISSDGTRKYRFLTHDFRAIEAVYIPDVGRRRRTNTLCVSSQTGCSVGCRFCFTAQFTRHRSLGAHEIVGQVLAVADDVAELGVDGQITNVVFMGMGEPLLNFDQVVAAARVMMEAKGLDLSTRRVTVSTSGIVPRIVPLGEALPVQLAISLNATTDETRARIMPINKKWPIQDLLAAMRAYPLGPRRRITVEYVLLDGVNDTPEDAQRLPVLLQGIPVKVNLLPLNAHDHTPFRPPSPERVDAFKQALYQAGLNVSVRTPRGQDIEAACGQLGEAQSEGSDVAAGPEAQASRPKLRGLGLAAQA